MWPVHLKLPVLILLSFLFSIIHIDGRATDQQDFGSVLNAFEASPVAEQFVRITVIHKSIRKSILRHKAKNRIFFNVYLLTYCQI